MGALIRCREQRKRAGLPYPRSSCEICGSVLRPGWRCMRDVGAQPLHPLRELANAIRRLAEDHQSWGQAQTIILNACAHLELLASYHERNERDRDQPKPQETSK